jgi:hypothetical protein
MLLPHATSIEVCLVRWTAAVWGSAHSAIYTQLYEAVNWKEVARRMAVGSFITLLVTASWGGCAR